VELLVVITIISMLMGLLLPAVQSAREAGRRATCLNNQKQLATAMLNYESSRRSFPGFANWVGQNQTIPASFMVPLFPYLEKQDLYNLWAGYGTVTNGATNTFAATPAGNPLVNPYMKMLICPSDSPDNTSDAWCSYVCNRGCNGFNQPCLGVCLDQATQVNPSQQATFLSPFTVTLDYINSHDGSSTTLLLAESLLDTPANPPQLFVPRAAIGDTSYTSLAKWSTPPSIVNANPTWKAVLTYAKSSQYAATYPGQPTNDLEAATCFEWSQWSATPRLGDKVLSRHPGGVVVSYCDGHQQFLTDNIDLCTFIMLMTPYDSGIPGRPTGGSTTIPNAGPTTTAVPAWNNSGNSVKLPYVPVLNAVLDESKFQ
jgi:prepilin-type processing-associated H-X9-DG protein